MRMRGVAVAGLTMMSVLGCGATRRALLGGSPAAIGSPPAGLDATAVAFPSESGSEIRGWFFGGTPGTGAVVLLHGVHANRLAMLDRARFLHAQGYAVLLPDFRAHGESSGTYTTFGALESRDARAAVCMARTLAPGERVGAIGVSMGGAAMLLGDRPLPVDALVIESVYSTIDRALENRLRSWVWLASGPLLVPMRGWIERSLSVRAADMRPIDRIAGAAAPVFVIAGTRDHYTTIDETRALYARAREPKQLWEVAGAGHVDLHAFAPDEYERRVGAFLGARLHRADGVQAARAASDVACGAASSARTADALPRSLEN